MKFILCAHLVTLPYGYELREERWGVRSHCSALPFLSSLVKADWSLNSEQCLFGPGSCTTEHPDWLQAQLFTLPLAGLRLELLGLLSSTFSTLWFYPLSKVTKFYHVQNVSSNSYASNLILTYNSMVLLWLTTFITFVKHFNFLAYFNILALRLERE